MLNMRKCRQCDGAVKRIHRNFWQRFKYLAVYRCSGCAREEFVPRFAYRMGDECRCPRCGTTRLVKLKERDRIDRMEHGIWNLLSRIAGGKLYHCCYCRMQFYDRRRFAETRVAQAPEPVGHVRVSH